MKTTRIWHAAISIILFAAIPTLSQETPRTNTVAGSALTRPVSTGASVTQDSPATDPARAGDDDVCNQRLLKALDALEKAERLVAALDAEITSRKKLDAVNAEILKAQDTVIGEQAKLIEILRKQTGRKISFLFGLVKIRY